MGFLDKFFGREVEEKKKIKKDKEAIRNGQLIIESMARRSAWVSDSVRWERIYATDQWSNEEREWFKKHKKYPLEINISAPIIDGLVGLACSNSPVYRTMCANGSSERINAIGSYILEYVQHKSKFREEMIRAAYDFYKVGIGWFQADVDTRMDYGFGDVVNRYVPWSDVHWDWTARRPGLQDRQWTILYGQETVAELKAEHPGHENDINKCSKLNLNNKFDEMALELVSASEDDSKHFRGDLMDTYGDSSGITREQVSLPVIERYELVYRDMFSVFDPAIGYEKFLTRKELENLPIPEIVKVNAYPLKMPRVRKVKSIGDVAVLADYDLPVTMIPLIPMFRAGGANGMPVGMMSRLEDVNYEQNKRRMAILDNAQATAVGRLLGPKGAVEEDVWDRLIGVPGAYIPYKKSLGLEKQDFTQLNAQSLPSAFFYLDQTQIKLGEYVAGTDAALFGMGQDMPETLGQSKMLEHYGMRKMRALDITQIESSLERLGDITLQLCQWWYDDEKVLNIIDDNGELNQVVINKRDIDTETGEVRGYLDDTRGMRFMVRVIPGSTLPYNKYARLLEAKELFDMGIVTEWEVLRYSNIKDKEAVYRRVSRLRKAIQIINEQEEQMKEMGVIIDQLKRQLRNLKIQHGVFEQLKTVELAAMQRKMQEKLSAAIVQLSQKQFTRDLDREAASLRRVTQARTQADISNFRAELNAARRVAEEKIANKVDMVEAQIEQAAATSMQSVKEQGGEEEEKSE